MIKLRWGLSFLILFITVLAFQNCSPGFKASNTSFNSENSNSVSSVLGAPQTVGVLKNGQGICNSVSFTQVPNNLDYFVGRVLKESSPGACDSSTWSLGLFKMNWQTNALEFVKNVFNPDVIETTGKKIASSYDPHLVQFNNELWITFECAGDFGIGASSCIAPFTIEKGVDVSRLNLLVMGSWVNSNTEAYSASVPKLLVFKGELYVYWTACHFVLENGSLLLTEVISRGAKLTQETSGLKRMWVKNSVGTALSAWDTVLSSEVWGATNNDATANSTADIFDFHVSGDTIYAVAAVGSIGCVTPLSPMVGCYRTRIASSTTPLGHHIFNNNFVKSPLMVGNPMEYTRFFKSPSGESFMMGQYLNPTLNGTARPASMISAGFQKYTIDLSSLKTVAVGTAEGMNVNPSPAAMMLASTFSNLKIFHRGCDSTSSTSVYCNAAASRYCQSQGYLSGTSVLQHVNDSASMACVGKNAGVLVDVTITQLTSMNASCTNIVTSSGACQSAVFHYCQNIGYAGGGFGPQEAAGNNLVITCLAEANSRQIATTFTALKTQAASCTSAVPAGDSCRAAADSICRSQGYVAGYGIVDFQDDSAILGCIL